MKEKKKLAHFFREFPHFQERSTGGLGGRARKGYRNSSNNKTSFFSLAYPHVYKKKTKKTPKQITNKN